MERKERSEEALGQELESLLARVPPPQAPPWFAAKTLARLRHEKDANRWPVFRWIRWRWIWAAGAAAVVAGWMLWDSSGSRMEISDAEVFAGLEALWQQEEENRWWAGL